MKNDNRTLHELAMDLSDGLFAWHLFGVLAVRTDKPTCLETVAREYLEDFHLSDLPTAFLSPEKS